MARAIPMERGLPRFSTRPRIGTIAKHIALIAVAAIVAYPFYFMVTSSFKDTLEAIRTPPTLFPNELHPENYTDAWNRAPWGRYFLNTIFVSVSVTVLELITACLAAYAFARLRFRGKAILFTFLGSWDAFQWPLIVTSKPDFRPVQVGLSAFRQEAGSSYHLLMAASTFVVAPIVLLFLVAQRYLVQGIARTGIRG